MSRRPPLNARLTEPWGRWVPASDDWRGSTLRSVRDLRKTGWLENKEVDLHFSRLGFLLANAHDGSGCEDSAKSPKVDRETLKWDGNTFAARIASKNKSAGKLWCARVSRVQNYSCWIYPRNSGCHGGNILHSPRQVYTVAWQQMSGFNRGWEKQKEKRKSSRLVTGWIDCSSFRELW